MKKIHDNISGLSMWFGFQKSKCPVCGNNIGIACIKLGDGSAIFWCECDSIFDDDGEVRWKSVSFERSNKGSDEDERLEFD